MPSETQVRLNHKRARKGVGKAQSIAAADRAGCAQYTATSGALAAHARLVTLEARQALAAATDQPWSALLGAALAMDDADPVAALGGSIAEYAVTTRTQAADVLL